MDPEQLEAFVAVTREGSFSRAARKIYRGQPAVTARIKALETELGVRLFDRLGRQVRLTPAGQALLERAGPLMEEWRGLASVVREAITGTLQGPVRIGSGEAALLYLLPEPLRAFRKRHSEVQVIVRNQSKGETLEMLRSGELDFGFRALDPVPTGFVYRSSRTFNRVLIAPKDHPVLSGPMTLKALSQHRFIFPWRGSVTRRIIEGAFEEAGLPLTVALEAGGVEVIKRYVALGLGIGVVLDFCLTAQDRRELGVRPARSIFGQDRYGVVVKQGRQLSRASQTLIKAIDPKFSPKPSNG